MPKGKDGQKIAAGALGVVSLAALGYGIYKLLEEKLPIVDELPPGVGELGIMLSNPPAGTTHFKWIVGYGTKGLIMGSAAVPVGDVAYALFPPVVIPSWLERVQCWAYITGEWQFIDQWIGEITITEYGIYEFNWSTKTLRRV